MGNMEQVKDEVKSNRRMESEQAKDDVKSDRGIESEQGSSHGVENGINYGTNNVSNYGTINVLNHGANSISNHGASNVSNHASHPGIVKEAKMSSEAKAVDKSHPNLTSAPSEWSNDVKEDPGKMTKQASSYGESNRCAPNNNIFFEERSNHLSSKGD